MPNQGDYILSASPDPDRMRAPDGLAGGSHDRTELVQGGEASYHQRDRVYGDLAPALDAYGDTPSDAPIVAFTKSHNVSARDGEHWATDREARAMNGFDGDRTTLVTGTVAADPLLPLGLDSHRYRCCGNGVVADVSFWVGQRLSELLAHPQQSIEGSVTPP